MAHGNLCGVDIFLPLYSQRVASNVSSKEWTNRTSYHVKARSYSRILVVKSFQEFAELVWAIGCKQVYATPPGPHIKPLRFKLRFKPGWNRGG